MDEVVRIEPTLGDQGLIAYECPNCVYVTSVLLEPRTLKESATAVKREAKVKVRNLHVSLHLLIVLGDVTRFPKCHV
jgi:hypothetical protein